MVLGQEGNHYVNCAFYFFLLSFLWGGGGGGGGAEGVFLVTIKDISCSYFHFKELILFIFLYPFK